MSVTYVGVSSSPQSPPSSLDVLLSLLDHLLASIHDKRAPVTTSVEHPSGNEERKRSVRAKMNLIDSLPQGDGAAAEEIWRVYLDEFTAKVLARDSAPGRPAGGIGEPAVDRKTLNCMT